MDELTAWIAAHTPVYYGPALAAWVVVYRFTGDFSYAWVRNLIRGVVFAMLLGSKFVVTADGIGPVPLWQHALTGSAGFALVALLFWTIGGFGLCLLLDAVLEVLKQATKALKNTVITAALLMAFGAVGALATAPLGRMLDARFAPPAIDIPPSAVPAVIEAIAPAPVTAAPVAAPSATPAPATTPGAAPATVAPASVPASTPASAPPPASTPATTGTGAR